MGVETALSAGRYVAYPEYRDSGVEWLSEIPSHWVCSDLKRFCDVTDGSHHSPKIQNDGLPFISVTDVGSDSIDFENSKKISEEDFKRLVSEGCKPNVGDVLLTKDGTIGRAALVRDSYPDFVILSSLGLLTPHKNLLNKFLYYYLISGVNIDQMNSLIHGSALRRMTISKIDGLLMILPSLVEQSKIANFLNHETAKIDTLIEEQQSLIRLLQEKRQAVISHAVTKGLNPDAPMKDSGVEWLGEVPEHWDVSQLKYEVKPGTSITYGIVQAGPHIENGIPYIKTGDMSGDSLPLDGYSKTSKAIDESYSRSKVFEGDIVIAIRATIGKCLPVPKELDGANLTQGTAKISAGKKLRSDFLLAFMSSTQVHTHLNNMAKGATFKEITLDMLRRTAVLIPPEDEQQHIANEVVRKQKAFDELTANATEMVRVLQERRTALISAAVTGKIDVRDWQAPEQQKAAV